MQVGGASDAGKVRLVNQDAFWVGEVPGKGMLAVVADGMGGHQTGEVASQQAVKTFRESFDRSRATPPAAMARASQAANLEIYEYALEHPEHRGMGTTLTTVLIDDQVAIVGHVGDSRAYLVRGGTIYQLTNDHSWVEEQLAKGLLTPEEAEDHEWRNLITRVLGTRPQVVPDLIETDVLPGDVLVLASDGLHGQVKPEEIVAELGRTRDRQLVVEYLIGLANERGGPDNITVVIAELPA